MKCTPKVGGGARFTLPICSRQPGDCNRLGKGRHIESAHGEKMNTFGLLCFLALFPAQSVDPAAQPEIWRQCTITCDDGSTSTVIWERRPATIKLPFREDNSVYVWYRDRSEKLSGTTFGHGPSRFLVSPDQKQAIALSHGEAGLIAGGVLIDFDTGKLSREFGPIDWDESRGWKPTLWHTTLEPLSNDGLFEEMRSPDETRCKLVMEEFDLRGVTAEDVAKWMDLLADPNAIAFARHKAAFQLYKLKPMDNELLTKVSAVASSDSSPKARLSAAWLLSELAPDCDDKVNLWYASRDEQLRDREISRIVKWWTARKAASSIPSKE